jgi:hypothetical protein
MNLPMEHFHRVSVHHDGELRSGPLPSNSFDEEIHILGKEHSAEGCELEQVNPFEVISYLPHATCP